MIFLKDLMVKIEKKRERYAKCNDYVPLISWNPSKGPTNGNGWRHGVYGLRFCRCDCYDVIGITTSFSVSLV